jgi:peptidyl-prolyl cis-trans isomerase D
MLRILRGGQRWLTALLVLGVGSVFVVFLGLQGPIDFASSQQIVKVGRFEFGLPEFERVRERREAAIQSELGEQFDSRALRETLDNMAARELVEQALLALAAGDMGLQVTTREIERLVLSDPGFRNDEGRFDRKRFEDFTEYAYGSQRAFMEERRLVLLSLKMLSLLNSQPEVSEGEARDVARRELEEVQIAFVVLGTDASGEPPEIAPEAISAAVTSRAEEIAKLYQEMGEEYNRPERVHARHILRSVARNAAPEEVERVQAEIDAIAARLATGESFEEVAQELSQDPGSQVSGGDLGFFARGQMVKEFEEAAFALAPGQTSAPVRSDFGFHLIKLEERQEALTRPLEAVREEIAAELLRREALRAGARARAEQLAGAVRDGQTLEDAAREHKVDLRRSGWVTRQGNGFVPGLGPSPELLAAAFVLEPGRSSPRIFEVPDGFALVQLLERKEADPARVDALVGEKREQLLEAKRSARTEAWIDARRDALVEAGELVVNLAPIQRS